MVLAFPVLVPSPHQHFILESHNFVVPATIYPTFLYFHSLTHCSPHPYLSPTILGPLTLVWSSRVLRLPFPVLLPHRSRASAIPTHSPHAYPPGLLPPSFLSPLSSPVHPHTLSVPGLDKSQTSSLCLRRSYIFWCLYCLSPRGYQSVCTTIYDFF